MAVSPHVHISPVHMVANATAVFVIFGTLHLLALGNNNRAARALIALGF